MAFRAETFEGRKWRIMCGCGTMVADKCSGSWNYLRSTTLISNNLSEQLRDAMRRMDSILRTKNRSSKEYMLAVRDYQKLLHLADSLSQPADLNAQPV
jgi:hypothetical protein